jgi:CHAT domain-containing protein
LPRIWWCATGPLAFLPIHAAGDYDITEVGYKLSDYAVSSYTPTLTAILDSSYLNPSKDFRLLTVAQPSAPNCSLIPKTMEEVERIAKVAGGVCVVNLAEEEATVEQVQRGIRESNWVHLACHGKQDVAKPLESCLILRDGTLKLSTIVQETLSNAEFAFLSACQTAMGDEKVAEESVHLAAGMLLAGYRGVIATMWLIRDDDGPRVAEVVYSRMLKDGKPNRREAAYALHDAVKQLRDSGAEFTSWVPFIHIGR